jgi:hypothetical protein
MLSVSFDIYFMCQAFYSVRIYQEYHVLIGRFVGHISYLSQPTALRLPTRATTDPILPKLAASLEDKVTIT